MDVELMMSRDVATCRPAESLASAARTMRSRDCGALPVVEASGRLVGWITDRDACMTALDLGRPLDEIPVSAAMTHAAVALDRSRSLSFAAELMGEMQLRRLPVLDARDRPIGVLSLVDLARRACSSEVRGPGDVGMDDVACALAAIGRPAPQSALPRNVQLQSPEARQAWPVRSSKRALHPERSSRRPKW